MARSRVETVVKQSLLDRLTATDAWPVTRGASLRMFREGLRRDVEWLLNTRRPQAAAFEGFPLASKSVVNYGLPDLTHMSSRRENAEALILAILNTLRTFEPRVHQPEVTMLAGEASTRTLRFQVRGTLRLETGEETVTFDTRLEIASGEYEVR
ncbi:MAG: type VI secretion system baseplate subunit TssE [Janthinobacterium lividum]